MAGKSKRRRIASPMSPTLRVPPPVCTYFPNSFVPPFLILVIMLTMNRPDGDLGSQYDHDLTTSFEDIILIPLPCWLFLLALVGFFAVNHMHKTRLTSFQPPATVKPTESGEPVISHSSSTAEPGARLHLRLRWTTYLYFLFTAGVLILSIDEIARLAILGWGVGLLPFLPIVTIIATVLYLMRYRLGAIYQGAGFERGITVRILVFWVMMMIVEAVKLHTLVKLQKPFPRNDSKYPMDQQVLDVAVLIGCMGLVFVLTLVEMLRPAMTVK